MSTTGQPPRRRREDDGTSSILFSVRCLSTLFVAVLTPRDEYKIILWSGLEEVGGISDAQFHQLLSQCARCKRWSLKEFSYAHFRQCYCH